MRPVWLNDSVLVYKLSGCGLESHWSHLIYCSTHKKPVKNLYRKCVQLGHATNVDFSIYSEFQN